MRLSPALLNRSIPTLHAPSLALFREHLAQKPTPSPARLTGLVDHWPALQSWTPANNLGRLREDAEGHVVPIEWAMKGRGYLDGQETGKGSMPLDVFLDAFILRRIPSSAPSPELDPLRTHSYYLAQHDLLSQIPSLAADVPHFLESYLLATERAQFWRSNIWIGPSGTFTPIHRDPYHNILVQIHGTKTVYLYPPDTPPSSLYLAPPPQQQTSLLPVSPPRLDPSSLLPGGAWELFSTTREEKERTVLVRKGEAVLIPEGWWHCVEGTDEEIGQQDDEDPRLSVNFWFR